MPSASSAAAHFVTNFIDSSLDGDVVFAALHCASAPSRAYGRLPGSVNRAIRRRTSHHGTYVPRHELFLPIALHLALGPCARCRFEHQPEQALADFGDARTSVDDFAAVEVDVLLL